MHGLSKCASQEPPPYTCNNSLAKPVFLTEEATDLSVGIVRMQEPPDLGLHMCSPPQNHSFLTGEEIALESRHCSIPFRMEAFLLIK